MANRFPKKPRSLLSTRLMYPAIDLQTGQCEGTPFYVRVGAIGQAIRGGPARFLLSGEQDGHPFYGWIDRSETACEACVSLRTNSDGNRY